MLSPLRYFLFCVSCIRFVRLFGTVKKEERVKKKVLKVDLLEKGIGKIIQQLYVEKTQKLPSKHFAPFSRNPEIKIQVSVL